MDEPAPLPGHDAIGSGQRALETFCIATAGSLLLWQAARIALTSGGPAWWHAPVLVAGMASADLASGMLHWFADSWGRESMPLVGRRLLRPFRVHHLNPDDFLLRDFVDTNGDVSMLLIPVLLGAAWISPHTTAGAMAASFVVAFAAAAWPTNQVHQWAHMPRPPLGVRWLQDRGIILGRPAHRRHHSPPFATSYCIATGWLNGPLEAVAFFPRLERLITAVSGLRPREDDARVTSTP